jgi:imidazolonepropionase-like amidohydrolase
VPTVIAGMTAVEMAKAGNVLSAAQADKARSVGDQIKRALEKSYKAGVRIAFGTDMGVGPHGKNAREFGYMVEAGMTAQEAIKAATSTASELLGIPEEVGTIAAGKSADIIAVEKSPLDDVSILERVSFVMARGHTHKNA